MKKYPCHLALSIHNKIHTRNERKRERESDLYKNVWPTTTTAGPRHQLHFKIKRIRMWIRIRMWMWMWMWLWWGMCWWILWRHFANCALPFCFSCSVWQAVSLSVIWSVCHSASLCLSLSLSHSLSIALPAACMCFVVYTLLCECRRARARWISIIFWLTMTEWGVRWRGSGRNGRGCSCARACQTAAAASLLGSSMVTLLLCCCCCCSCYWWWWWWCWRERTLYRLG